MGAGLLEVFDLDVEMHHHLLVFGVGRPRRADIGVLKLEGEADTTTVGIGQRDPLRFVGPDLPPEQSGVETGQLPRVGRVEHDAGDLELRFEPLILLLRMPHSAYGRRSSAA